MKTKVTIIAALAILLSVTFTFVRAQSTGEPVVKILPTNKKGLVKILYVSDADRPVEVKFYSSEGLHYAETVDPFTFNKGFLKKYDVSHIEAKNYWIEISDDVKSITYKVVRSEDLQRFTSVLEQTTYRNPLIVSVN